MQPPSAVVPVAEEMIRQVTLVVTVKNGAHMPKMDTIGKCDAYCALEWAQQTHETEPHLKTYMPEWNKTFPFKPCEVRAVPAPVGEFALRVFDFDSVTDSELIGVAFVSAEDMAKVSRSRNNHDTCHATRQ